MFYFENVKDSLKGSVLCFSLSDCIVRFYYSDCRSTPTFSALLLNFSEVNDDYLSSTIIS